MSIRDRVREIVSGDEWDRQDAYFKERHGRSGATDYERARAAYAVGFAAGNDPRYRGRRFDDVERELQASWTPDLAREAGPWSSVRSYVGEAFNRARELVVTRSEEELTVGKRTVPAGEVDIRKSVETEHVRREVPLTHDEVTIERHAVTEGRADAGELGEEEIRVPLRAEEAVVEKRPVVKEEIVVRKRAVEDSRTIEADVRKERVDVDDTTRRRGRGEEDIRGR